MKPLVSVIIPCYNYGGYLEPALRSVLGQRYRPLEVLIVDDGSTDSSVERARVLAKRHKEVRVIARPHKGRSATFNAGIRAAKGAYVVKLDADDKLHPEFVSRLVGVLESKPELSYAYTNARMFGSEQSVVFCQPYDAKKLFYSSGFFATSLFRREVFEKVGGYDEAMETAEDWELYLRCAERGLRGFLVPEVLFYYRRHKRKSPVGSVRRGLKAYVTIIRKHRKSYTPLKACAVLANAVVIWALGGFWPRGHDIVRKQLYNHGIGAFYRRVK